MNLYEKIKQLASLNNINIAMLERNCELSQGSIAKWQNSSPKVDNLIKIADYFSVTVGYLLGREITHPKSNLTLNQQKLLNYFNACDEITQEQIIGYAEYLYKKEGNNKDVIEKTKKA